MKRSRMGNWSNVSCSTERSWNNWGLKNNFHSSGKRMSLSCLKNFWIPHWRKHWNKKNTNDTPCNRGCCMRSCKIWSFVSSLNLRNSILDCVLTGCYKRSCMKMKALRSYCLMKQKMEANCRTQSYCCLRLNVN